MVAVRGLTIFLIASLGVATAEPQSGTGSSPASPDAGSLRAFSPDAGSPRGASSGVRPLLDSDRRTMWNPGLMSAGGIPSRTKICEILEAAKYGNGAREASSAIQAALDDCPEGSVVQLSAGTFRTNHYVIIRGPVTLRGAGAGVTILKKTNGASQNLEVPPDAQPNLIIGRVRWPRPDEESSQALAQDAEKGASSVTVANGKAFGPGQVVLVDELSGASWQPDPLGRGRVWASPDWRVVWKLHDPRQPDDDPLTPTTPTGGDAASWFSRQDRVTAEWKEIASVNENVITFTSPLHIAFRRSHSAQVTGMPPEERHLKHAGVEDLTVVGGSDGAIRFMAAAYSWARSVEVTTWHGEGVAIDHSFRVEVRDSYIHDAAWAQPGGAGYAVSLSTGTSEVLFENNISVMANKVMVARAAGAGSVFGYNYVDDGYINTNGSWVEVGLNASHMVGPHHVLFEGNYGFNWDSDHTHGSSTYHTVFRNWLSGYRKKFTNPLDGKTWDDATQAGIGPKRCAGVSAYTYWMSFIGNVLGTPGAMTGWTLEPTGPGGMLKPAIWLLGWDDKQGLPYDATVAPRTLRHGNFDYLTGSVGWDPEIADRDLPPSLYLKGKPAFFNKGKGYTWPWVDPVGPKKLFVLPAKARFDAGTPFKQP